MRRKLRSAVCRSQSWAANRCIEATRLSKSPFVILWPVGKANERAWRIEQGIRPSALHALLRDIVCASEIVGFELTEFEAPKNP